MMGWLLSLAAGAVTGVLSAFGIGGGSLLLIYLTAFAALDQHQAQGINLLYFLPAAAAALAGDQPLTHPRGGNNAGVLTLLVHPIRFGTIFRFLRFVLETPFRAGARRGETL